MLILLIKVFIAQSSCIEVECQDTPDPQSRCIEVTQTIKVAGCPAGMYCPSYSSISNYNETSQILDVYCEYLLTLQWTFVGIFHTQALRFQETPAAQIQTVIQEFVQTLFVSGYPQEPSVRIAPFVPLGFIAAIFCVLLP